MKRNSSVLQLTGTKSAPSSPPQLTKVSETSTDVNCIIEDPPSDDDDIYNNKTLTIEHMNLSKQKRDRLNHLSDVNNTCTSTHPAPNDALIGRQGAGFETTEDGFGQFFILSESDTEEIILEKEYDQDEGVSNASVISPSFDDSVVSSSEDNNSFLEVDRCDSDDKTMRSEESDQCMCI